MVVGMLVDHAGESLLSHCERRVFSYFESSFGRREAEMGDLIL